MTNPIGHLGVAVASKGAGMFHQIQKSLLKSFLGSI